VYTESTDGSNVEAKESALVWHYRDADPDFGHWQARPPRPHAWPRCGDGWTSPMELPAPLLPGTRQEPGEACLLRDVM
jgi:hypothetical protein